MENKSTIIIHRDPSGILGRDIISVTPGEPIINYLERVHSGGPFNAEIYLNAVKIGSELAPEDCAHILAPCSVLHIVYRPQGLDPISLVVIAVIAAVVTISLIPDPQIPNDAGLESASPNNTLSGQTNIARPYQAVPEIFGRIIAYPDLLQPSLFEYVADIKQVREVFGLGVGEYLIDSIKSGQSIISQIPGSTATVRGPGDTPPDLQIGRETNDINGQELRAPDDPTVSSIGRLVFDDKDDVASPSGVQFTSPATINVPVGSFAYDLDLQVGDQVTVSGTTSNNATFTIGSITDNAGDVRLVVTTSVTTEGPTSATFTRVTTAPMVMYSFDEDILTNLGVDVLGVFTVLDTTSNNGDFTIITAAADVFLPTIDATPINVIKFVVTETVIDEDDSTAKVTRVGQDPDANVGFFQLADVAEEVWTHLQMPQGIRSEDGDVITINIEVDIQETDSVGTPTGPIDTQTYTFKGGTQSGQFQTNKFVVPNPGGFYRTRARRITNKFAGSAADLVKWEDSVAVVSYSGSNFGDITTVDVNTVATNFATSSSQRKINIDCTRKLPTWTAGGGFDPTLTATRSFARAVLYSLNQAAGRPLSEIDLVALFGIADGLSDSRLGQFDFSFDESNVGLGDRIKTICNSARVGVYRDGQTWRFVRDEAQPFRTALFNRRNISADTKGSQNWTMHKPADFDSIALRFTDPVTNKRAESQIRIDSGTSSFIEGSLGSRPKRIDLAGCRDSFQANDRARMEIRKILRQRRRVKEIVLNDGLLVNPGDRVGWSDVYDGEIFDGEILDQSDTLFTTSEQIVLDPLKTYVGSITDSTGVVTGPVPVSAAVGDLFAFTASFSSSALIADGITVQAGSRYLIGTVDDDSASDFIINSRRSSSEGKIELNMVNYDETIYELDGQE